MRAIWLRASAELRSRWRATLALIILVGLAAGVVMSAAAGARRTQTAYPRFLETAHAADALISVPFTGIPSFYPSIGIGAGRWVWTLFAEQLGVPPEPTISFAAIALAIPATLIVANLVSAIPGRVASRMHPAVILRTE
jgi:hypothetical protein